MPAWAAMGKPQRKSWTICLGARVTRRSSPRRSMKRRRCSSTGSINPRASGKRRIHAIRSWSTASRFRRRGSSLAPRCEKRSPVGEPTDTVKRSASRILQQGSNSLTLLRSLKKKKEKPQSRRKQSRAAEYSQRKAKRVLTHQGLLRRALQTSAVEVLRRVCKKTTPPAPVPQTLRAILQRSGNLPRPSEGSACGKCSFCNTC